MARIALFALGMATLAAIHLFEGGHMAQLVQPGAVVLCIAAPLLLTLAIYGRRDFILTQNAVLPAAFVKARSEESQQSNARSIEVLAGLRMLCLAMGGLSVMASVILCTLSLDDPSRLGVGIALGLLSAMYMVGFAELCIAPLLDQFAVASLNPAGDAQVLPKAAQKRSLVIDLGVLVSVIACTGVVMAGMDRLDAFLHPAPLLFVMVYIPLNIAFHGWRGHYNAFVTGYSPDEASPQQRAQHVLVLGSARTLVYALGSIGLMVGLVHIFGSMSDPTKIFGGLAICMLSPLYSVAIAELFISPRIACLQAAGGLGEGAATHVAAAVQENRAPLRMAVAAISAVMLMLVMVMFAIETDPTSRFHESSCCDRVDNDGDGLIDSADPDCQQLKVECPEPKEAAGVGTAPRLSKEAARALAEGPDPIGGELETQSEKDDGSER